MRLEFSWMNIILMIGVTFGISALLVPIAKKIAFHIGAIDYPNQRRLNKEPMPTIGGLAVFIAFFIAAPLSLCRVDRTGVVRCRPPFPA